MTVTASGLNGTSSFTATVRVEPNAGAVPSVTGVPISAGFIASAGPAGNIRLFSFNNISRGAATSWLWDFGDGNTSTEFEPTHRYAQAGRYNVTITAIGPNDRDSFSAIVAVR